MEDNRWDQPTIGYIAVKKGYKYQTQSPTLYYTNIFGHNAHTDYIRLYDDGIMILAKGYAYDGPSGPTIDGDSNMYAAGGHDALYQLIRLGLIPKEYKKNADSLFYEWCIQGGMWKIRAYTWEKAVNIFGNMCLDEDDEDNKIFVYPRKYTSEFIFKSGIHPSKVRR
jgi:hypothetical protein